MSRINQTIFAIGLVWLSWLVMMAVHELGHVLGAVCTGGSVNAVDLHPFSISRTVVAPNPSPGIVVWCGPIIGSLIPCVTAMLVRQPVWNHILRFMAGFCLIANGAYVAVGSIDEIGDAGVILRTGTPVWAMYVFGLVTIIPGFWIWHRLGTLREFWANPDWIKPAMNWVLWAVVLVVMFAVLVSSPR